MFVCKLIICMSILLCIWYEYDMPLAASTSKMYYLCFKTFFRLLLLTILFHVLTSVKLNGCISAFRLCENYSYGLSLLTRPPPFQ